ncbi:WD40/YVTN/BNR-like repeat-containing protein [Neobacillus sp. Marseille-QA0830]
MKKAQIRFLIIISLVVVIFIILQKVDKGNENPSPKPVEVKKEDINSKLPYTLQVAELDQKPETIAYRIWFDFMNRLETEGAITDARFTRFTKLSGDDNSFVAAVVFEVQLPEGLPKIDYSWGEMKDNRMVPNIVWKLTINKGENLSYTLTSIERTTDTQIGLPPVETTENYRKNAGIKEPSKSIDYEINDQKLRVTYNNGKDWTIVPVAIENLLRGDNDSEQQLIDGSYVITPEITAFVLNKGLRVLISKDKGRSWSEVLVSDQLPALRMRILGFTSDQDGYLIVTGDKTMGSEANFVFKTNDGGQSWYSIGSVDDVYSLVTGGGFINDQLGFISFGEYRYDSQPPIPNIYRTADGGANWERVEVPIPEEYLGYFTIADVPTFHGTEGTLLVNQGSEGDYLGGKVLAKFTSYNQGETWSFAGLVDPDGVLQAK